MSGRKPKFSCKACGIKFYIESSLTKHNCQLHSEPLAPAAVYTPPKNAQHDNTKEDSKNIVMSEATDEHRKPSVIENAYKAVLTGGFNNETATYSQLSEVIKSIHDAARDFTKRKEIDRVDEEGLKLLEADVRNAVRALKGLEPRQFYHAYQVIFPGQEEENAEDNSRFPAKRPHPDEEADMPPKKAQKTAQENASEEKSKKPSAKKPPKFNFAATPLVNKDPTESRSEDDNNSDDSNSDDGSGLYVYVKKAGIANYPVGLSPPKHLSKGPQSSKSEVSEAAEQSRHDTQQSRHDTPNLTTGTTEASESQQDEHSERGALRIANSPFGPANLDKLPSGIMAPTRKPEQHDKPAPASNKDDGDVRMGDGDAEPRNVEPIIREPIVTEPSNAEPSNAEPTSDAKASDAEASDAEPRNAEPIVGGPIVGEPIVTEPSNAEPSNAQPEQPSTSKSPKTEPLAKPITEAMLLATRKICYAYIVNDDMPLPNDALEKVGIMKGHVRPFVISTITNGTYAGYPIVDEIGDKIGDDISDFISGLVDEIKELCDQGQDPESSLLLHEDDHVQIAEPTVTTQDQQAEPTTMKAPTKTPKKNKTPKQRKG